jgi:hypothetical protein
MAFCVMPSYVDGSNSNRLLFAKPSEFGQAP